MRFLLAVLDIEGNPGNDDEMAAIDAFNERLVTEGHWIMACGVEGRSSAIVVDNRDGLGAVTAGPAHDAAEFMSGFWLITAESREQALELAQEGSRCCNRRVEVRALHGE